MQMAVLSLPVVIPHNELNSEILRIKQHPFGAHITPQLGIELTKQEKRKKNILANITTNQKGRIKLHVSV